MKKIVSLILTLSIMLSVFLNINLIVTAKEKTANNYEDKDEYIYYSDLFYAYPEYLTEDMYLNTYCSDIEGLYDFVYTAYKNSPLVIATGIDYALDTVTSPIDIAKLITDKMGLTDFTYNDALDAANELFVKEIMSESSLYSIEKAFGKTEKFNKKISKTVEYFNKLDLESDDSYTDYNAEYFVRKAFDFLFDQGYINFLSEEIIANLWCEINEKDFSLKNCFKIASTEIDIAKAIMVALMLEDSRFEIVDDIISTQNNDTVLKRGMTRLKNKLQKSFIEYFIQDYILKEVADRIFDEINKIIIEDFMGKEFTAVLGVIKDVLNAVVDFPSYADALRLQVLICYSKDIANAIPAISLNFAEKSFLSDCILDYENMFVAYDAVNKAAMDAVKKIADMIDPYGAAYEVLKEAREKNIEYITIKTGLDIVPVLSSTTDTELYRILTMQTVLNKVEAVGSPILIPIILADNIEVSNGIKTIKVPIKANILSSALKGGLSECQQNLIDFNTKYKNKNLYEEHIKSVKENILNIPYISRKIIRNREYNIDEKTNLKIQSDSIEKNAIYTFNNSLLGNVNLGHAWDYRYPQRMVFSFPIKIYGDLKGMYARYCAQELTITENASLEVFGDIMGFQASYPSNDYPQTTIKNYGNMVIHGNCSNIVYKDSKESSALVDGNWSLRKIESQIDGEVNVSGNVELSDSASIINNGCTKVNSIYLATMNYHAGRNSITNNGYFEIVDKFESCGDTYGNSRTGYRIIQEKSDAEFVIGGDFLANTGDVCETVTGGTVIFNGIVNQKVKNLKAYSVTINNPNGITYLSEAFVSGLYDTQQNNIHNNGFVTVITDTTRFIKGSDYKKLRMQSDINLTQSVKGDIETTGYSITVPENAAAVIDGNVSLNRTKIDVYGQLEVTGNIDVANNSTVNNYNKAKIGSIYLATMNHNAGRNSITNNGYLEIVDKFESCSDTYANSGTGYRIIQETDNAVLVIDGEFYANTWDVCDTITKGIVIFNGSTQQNIKNIKAPTVILTNESASGVVFMSAISLSILFDHRGNKFTLYNNGLQSSFADYDDDGLNDNIDPYPTVGNSIYGVGYLYTEEGVTSELFEERCTKIGVKTNLNKLGILKNEYIGTGTILSLNDLSYTVLLKGDTTGDGEIDIFDILGMLDHVNGDTELEGVYEKAGLVVNEEEIDIFDTLAILDHVNGDISINP